MLTYFVYGLYLIFLAMSSYLFVLTIASFFNRKDGSSAPSYLSMAIVVPAHNEETMIEETVKSLRCINYPRAFFEIFVIADNCTDTTAECAKSAGAFVLTRTDLNNRGKGHALKFAFEWLLSKVHFDAVVVVDADSIVSSDLLMKFNSAFRSGAAVVQARYGVRNPKDSWRSKLMALALSLFHDVRSLGRNALRLSCGLRGNGMGFLSDVLKQVPYCCYSLTEDIEYGIRLGMNGIHVKYIHDAEVLGEMPNRACQAKGQRIRWELGRWRLLNNLSLPLFKSYLKRPSFMLLDLWLDLAVLPLSYISLGVSCCLVIGFAVQVSFGTPTLMYVAVLSAFMLVAYVLRGLALCPLGWRASFLLLSSPVFVMWKIWTLCQGVKASQTGWVRTLRSKEVV